MYLLRLFLIIAMLPKALATAALPNDERALSLAKRTENKVFRTPPTIHWLPERSEFWYSVQAGADTREWVRVEPATGKITRAPNAESLALPAAARAAAAPARSRASEEQMHLRFINRRAEPVDLFWLDLAGRRQTYGRIHPNQTREQHTFAGHVWLIADTLGRVLLTVEAGKGMGDVEVKADIEPLPPAEERRRPRSARNQSPDGRWTVRFERDNALLHDATTGEIAPLTTDGTEAQPYRGPASWSPDGKAFVLLSVREVARRKVTIVEAAPGDQLQPKVHSFDYLKPGDDLPRPQLVLFRLDDRRPQRIASDLFPNPFTERGDLPIRWSPASDEFFFDYNQRGHQLYRIIAVNARSAAARVVVEETARTFIDYTNKTERRWLDGTRELLWLSERDGWAHLWLYDTASGAVKNQVTRGEWVVRDIVRLDEKARVVWFLASGLRAGEDPYHQHLCRVNFDGTGFRQLTEADGNHFAEFSPDGQFFIDRWSRADHPPVVELRRTSDGSLVCELERADASALLAAGWTMPERFVAKGRDNKTDIHGILIKPSDFDPAKSYPVLEEVYAGPQDAFAPKDFGRLLRHHILAELGFIVVQADGMGTNHRGKAFHDVAWKNLQDAGFPDRIAWLRAAAASRPWMDLSRVGIYGGSAGGQNAMRAVLDHADFYKAAFADCGCHDNRMDKIWWNEQWLGWPVDESYVRASNVVDAHKLGGALMLSVGALDSNVDPASTMQVVDALQKADKDFELLVMPGSNHGAAETPYASRRRMEFFVRHLRPGAAPSAAPAVTSTQLSPEVRKEFGLAPFYQKCVLVGGLPVVGSAKVTDAALRECAWIVSRMLERRPDILKALAKEKVRFAIMAHNEYTTDIPEHANLEPRVYWDRRARGLGATPESPVVSGGEENLLAFPGDPYPREIIPIHEFAHAIHEVALRGLDPDFDGRLRGAYEKAIAAGLWKGTYAAVNRQEYWAEAVQAWFDNNDSNNALHNDINTRAKLKTYDPGVAALCEEVFGDIAWRYQKPSDRRPEDRAHLTGFDPSKAPRFRWRDEPVPERPRVTLDSAAGSVELEISGSRDVLARLLQHCQNGYFSGGHAVIGETLRLMPAEKTPDGAAVPPGEGHWNFGINGNAASGLTVKAVRGEDAFARIAEAGEQGVRVQRIVRLN